LLQNCPGIFRTVESAHFSGEPSGPPFQSCAISLDFVFSMV
jgi:hypothetical protein